MYLIDTNVLSELRKGNTAKINEQVALWASSVHLDDLYISVITLQEIQTGILLLKRKDPVQAGLLQKWMNEYILVEFKGRILTIDIETALTCSQLHVPDKRPYADSLIAATAITHKLTLVTRNISDFNSLKVNLINPWSS